MEKLNSYERSHLVHKIKTIYYLEFYGKGLLTPSLDPYWRMVLGIKKSRIKGENFAIQPRYFTPSPLRCPDTGYHDTGIMQ